MRFWYDMIHLANPTAADIVMVGNNATGEAMYSTIDELANTVGNAIPVLKYNAKDTNIFGGTNNLATAGLKLGTSETGLRTPPLAPMGQVWAFKASAQAVSHNQVNGSEGVVYSSPTVFKINYPYGGISAGIRFIETESSGNALRMRHPNGMDLIRSSANNNVYFSGRGGETEMWTLRPNETGSYKIIGGNKAVIAGFSIAGRGIEADAFSIRVFDQANIEAISIRQNRKTYRGSLARTSLIQFDDTGIIFQDQALLNFFGVGGLSRLQISDAIYIPNTEQRNIPPTKALGLDGTKVVSFWAQTSGTLAPVDVVVANTTVLANIGMALGTLNSDGTAPASLAVMQANFGTVFSAVGASFVGASGTLDYSSTTSGKPSDLPVNSRALNFSSQTKMKITHTNSRLSQLRIRGYAGGNRTLSISLNDEVIETFTLTSGAFDVTTSVPAMLERPGTLAITNGSGGSLLIHDFTFDVGTIGPGELPVPVPVDGTRVLMLDDTDYPGVLIAQNGVWNFEGATDGCTVRDRLGNRFILLEKKWNFYN